MSENSSIIPFQEEHYEEIKKIFHQGFGSKLTPFIGKIKMKLYDDLAMIYPKPFKGNFVAITDKKVSGFIWLFFKNQEKNGSKRLSLGKILEKYGFGSLLRFIFFDIIFHHETKEGELYIDTLGVSTQSRGKGIGSSLLKFTDLWARDNGFTHLTLCVIEKNTGAKKLYEREGFEVVSYSKSRFVKIITKIEGFYFMKKDL